MADSTLKYGTKVIAMFGVLALGLGGGAIYYMTNPRVQVYPEDMAELIEGISERENVAGGIRFTNRVVLHVYPDDLIGAQGIDARINQVCGQFVAEDYNGAGVTNGWNIEGCYYVMWSYSTLIQDAMDEYNPDGQTNIWQWITISSNHIYVSDLTKRYMLIKRLKSTVTNELFGCGNTYQYGTNITTNVINQSTVMGHVVGNVVGTNIAFVSIEDLVDNWLYDSCGWDNYNDRPYCYPTNFFSRTPPNDPKPDWFTWDGPDLYRMITASATPQTNTVTECNRGPYRQWDISYAATWDRGVRAYSQSPCRPYPWARFYDSISLSQGYGYYLHETTLVAPLPARQVPIGGAALFRWNCNIFPNGTVGTEDGQYVSFTNTDSTVETPDVVPVPAAIPHAEDFDVSPNNFETIDHSSADCRNYDDPYWEKSAAGSTNYFRTGTTEYDLRKPVKLRWNFEFCVPKT